MNNASFQCNWQILTFLLKIQHGHQYIKWPNATSCATKNWMANLVLYRLHEPNINIFFFKFTTNKNDQVKEKSIILSFM